MSLIITRLVKEHVKPHFTRLAIAAILMIIVAITSALHVWMIQPALDQIFLSKNQQMLHFIPMAIITIALVKGAATYGQNYLMKFVGQRIVTDMQIKLYEHLLNSDISYLLNQSSGKLISRFTNDIMIMRGAVSTVLTAMVRESLTVIFLVGLMFYQNTVLSLIAFIVFPVAVIPIIRLGKRMRKISHSTQEELGKYTTQLDDSFQSIRVIKSFRREDFEINRARVIVENIFNLYIKAVRTESLSSPIMETLSGVAIASVIWYGGSQVIAGTTTPGSFFSFIVAFIAAYKPIKTLSDLNTNLQEGIAAATRLFTVLDIEQTIIDQPNAKNLEIKNGEIIFDHVTLTYSTGKKALDDISLTIPAGKITALVGPSGSGKSSIIGLLTRFYDPEAGEIKVDLQNIKQVTLATLRENISVVSQDIMLFDDTVAANIAYGKLGASMDEIIAAAKAADAHEFISNLPNGYQTIIGPHGLKLSGGQRQRMSIARAIIKDAPIMLLDEATSSLDSITEQKIQKALTNLRLNRTTIIIAHRLTTISDADLIYVIKNGQVVESGNHQTLLAQGQEYFNLYNSTSVN